MSDEEDLKFTKHRTTDAKSYKHYSNDEKCNGFTKGYCLVFTKEPEYGVDKTKPYIIELIDNTLKIYRNPNMKRNEYVEDGWQSHLQHLLDVTNEQKKEYEEKKLQSNKKKKQKKYNLLTNFEDANILFQIEPDRVDKYFYVIISAHETDTENWAEKHQIDVRINPIEAVKIGREFEEFKLARRTYIEGDNDTTFTIEHDNDEYYKCDISLWENIHIAYNSNVKREIYSQENGSIITNTLYLRVLYEMLTDDTEVGGANFIVEKFLTNKYHPLADFFALNEPNRRPKYTRDNAGCCKFRKISDNIKLSDDIRAYYGESVGFYFHFLIHYTKWLYPMAALGLVWFLIQMAASERFGIAAPGSTIIVVIAIMWSTMMIENWYRTEGELRFKWGMLRYTETEIPRPSFSGKMIISPENGEYIETYKSGWEYFCKVVCSMGTMFLCVAIVISIVFCLFLLRGNYENRSELTIGIGMANSIQIFIMNKIYTYLAYKLNEWEGHRLQQDYYNNLVVKRITFIVFNSFYSLFYIAFVDDRELYNDDRIRLEAVRKQLITLFLMAIFLQNTMEILFPWVGKKIATFCAKREEERRDENTGLISSLETNTIKDMIDQIKLVESPDILDNTAEIVVLHGYIMLFVIIFPIMPFLALINNYVELRVDVYNMTNAKRPVPASAAGLGVWKSVLSCFNIIAVFSNLAILTFRTPLIHNVLIDIDEEYDTENNLIIFYFCAVLVLLLIIFVIRNVIGDVTQSTKEAIARQEACERHLLKAVQNESDTKGDVKKLKKELKALKTKYDKMEKHYDKEIKKYKKVISKLKKNK